MAKNKSFTVRLGDKKEIPVARVTKYTPVKEGQQYPTGRGGQMKAFHEHVWPKGFSPERRRTVSEMQFPIYGRSHTEEVNGKLVDRNTPDKLARAHVEETIARSTMPVGHMEQMKKGGTAFHVRETGNIGNPTSSFERSYNKINLNIKPHDTGADVSHQLMHEVGHAIDYINDSQQMANRVQEMTKPGVDYGPLVPTAENKGAHPVLEGTAEGYSAAHARITSAQKRTGGDVSKYGYNPLSWKSAHLGSQFIITRNKTYRQETGKPFDEPEVEAPRKRKPANQPNLFAE